MNSLRVGDVYYVGHLPWFERLWYALLTIRFCSLSLAAVSVVLLACRCAVASAAYHQPSSPESGS
ncbi:hypothetical protein KIF59_21820 [Enterobacter cloacae subsp. cloacae]|nr:hypothetical protein [Enterobacter cloacae subsp. cloacae]